MRKNKRTNMEYHTLYKSANSMMNHYKKERDRLDRCLGDITSIISETIPEIDRLDRIIERLTRHYDRVT